MKRDVVISCFDLTGNMVEHWVAAGYECHVVDLQHPAGKSVECGGKLIKWGMDVYEWEKVFFDTHPGVESRMAFAAFFPPCTDLAVSGARWFAEKERKNPGTRRRAMDLVFWSDRIGQRLNCPYFIENPVSVISTEWRKPDFVFHPYYYGGYGRRDQDGYKKTTCLWTGGGFDMPPERRVTPDPKIADKIHRMAPGPDRQNLRSQTPKGFSKAIFGHYHRPDSRKRKRDS